MATGIRFQEQPAAPIAPAATHGTLWVKDDVPNTLHFTDDAGGDIQLGASGPGTDTTAIHDNVASEISAVALKATPVSGDFLLIEDSAAGDVKKRITLGTLPGTSQTLAQTLAVGNTTGGTNIIVSSGDEITTPVGSGGGAGGDLIIYTGAGNGAGQGGDLSVYAGSGGATGKGGDLYLAAGSGSGTFFAGGQVTVLAGSANGAGDEAGGNVVITAGNSTGTQEGGNVQIKGGTGATTATSNGGVLIAGATGNSNIGGVVHVAGGAGNDGKGGGLLNLFGGAGEGIGGGGTIVLRAGAGGSDGKGGALTVESGSGQGSQAGGAITVLAGVSGTTNATGAAVTITAANSGTATGTGGNVTINAGDTTGAGTGGNIVLNPGTTVAGTDGTTQLTGLKTQVNRIQHSLGTALVAGDFALSGGWGTTASVTSITGTDSRFILVVTSSGTGQAANPTITLTYKDGAWPSAPFPLAVGFSNDGAGAFANLVLDLTTRTTTSAVYTVRAHTPVASYVYTFTVHVLG